MFRLCETSLVCCGSECKKIHWALQRYEDLDWLLIEYFLYVWFGYIGRRELMWVGLENGGKDGRVEYWRLKVDTFVACFDVDTYLTTVSWILWS